MLNYLTAMQAEGRLALAEAGFARILEQAPTHVHAWLGLGYCASLGGEPDIARRAFDTAASLGPQTDETALDCALALAHIGRTDAARSLLVARPESFGRQMALGALEESCGALAAAVGCYAAAHAADPAADQPLHRLVPLHRRLGDLATAHAMVDRLADLGPRQAVLAWHMRGILHASAGDRDAAIAAWRAGLACDPSCEAFTTDLAMALRQSCKVEEARAVLTARPPSYGILLALTELDLSLRDHAAALAHSAAAHALQPRRPEPLLRMARIEADRGNFAAARAAAERIEACCGAGHRRVMLRSLLATARIAGDARAALDSLRAMAALEPRDAGIAADLARQYRILGEPAAARQALRTALALDDQDQQALSEAVDQANLTDDRVGALAFAQRALAAAPDLAGQALRVAARPISGARPSAACGTVGSRMKHCGRRALPRLPIRRISAAGPSVSASNCISPPSRRSSAVSPSPPRRTAPRMRRCSRLRRALPCGGASPFAPSRPSKRHWRCGRTIAAC
jgi:tetratricopeptide (TPR) repeat protein